MNNHIPQAEEERKNSNVFVQGCGIESLNMRISEIFISSAILKESAASHIQTWAESNKWRNM